MQKHTERERETRIYEVRQDAYILGTEEREILIYIRVQEKLHEILSRTHFSLISKIWVTSSIYRGRRKPQNSPGRVRINSDPTAGRPVRRPIQEYGQPPGRCSMLQSFTWLTGKTDRLVGRPIQRVSSLLSRSVDQCVPLYTSVGRWLVSNFA